MGRIFIIALEPIETRYTGQWFDGIPLMLREEINKRNTLQEVYQIAGQQVEQSTTSGAFLNFAATNIWKNTQINIMCENFMEGRISKGDKILFTDAWNTGILQIKYMSELLDIPVEIHGIWHAGSYDEYDLLGQKIKDKRWSYATERAIYYACDYNYFATQFHADMFERVVLGVKK